MDLINWRFSKEELLEAQKRWCKINWEIIKENSISVYVKIIERNWEEDRIWVSWNLTDEEKARRIKEWIDGWCILNWEITPFHIWLEANYGFEDDTLLGDDFDFWIENQFVASADVFMAEEKAPVEEKEQTFFGVNAFNQTIKNHWNFEEAFSWNKIEDIAINSIFLSNGKMTIMSSYGWNKNVEGSENEAFELVNRYVEGLANKFKQWEDIVEQIGFNYNNGKRIANLIGIHKEVQTNKEVEKVFEDFVVIVWLDGNYQKAVFGTWLKNNFMVAGSKLEKISFRI